MSDYNWQNKLEHAIKQNRREAHNRYLQLATIRDDGSPACRTVVFRSMVSDQNLLEMITDNRSDKVDEISKNPRGEICWYFSRSREQFRLSGLLSLAGAENNDQGNRLHRWSTLSDGAKAQFFWPSPGVGPAQTLPELVPEPERDGPDLSVPPETFLVMQLQVTRVDHLTLKGSPQTRVISTLSDQRQWSSQDVNP